MTIVNSVVPQRVKELAERYETPLPVLKHEVTALEESVIQHLERVGFACS
jgi:type I restriction enzyme M protein